MRHSHPIVSREDWLLARRALLRDEKALIRFKDAVTRQRQQLPWVLIDKKYQFEDADGNLLGLGDLFEGRTQLIVYHFMYPSHWDTGCPGCTEVADNFNGIIDYLNHRDASLAAVSRGAIDKLEEYKQRHRWTFRWVSSENSDFNFDFNVSFRKPEGEKMLNFRRTDYEMEETHGVSVFIEDEGNIYHTYTCHARGVDLLFCSLQYMDLLPLGRQDNLYYGDGYRRVSS